jgi:uncharacterized lipoprotein YddW (UPF0748 family)
MTRRRFIERTGALVATAAGISGGTAVGCAAPDRNPEEDGGETVSPSIPLGWTWVHGSDDHTPVEWRARFATLREAGLHGVLVSGGDKALLSDAARGAGLEFHRWMWTLNRSGDQTVKAEHPDWFTVSRNGESSLEHPPYVGYYQWLCPTRAGVRDYLRGIVDEMATDPDLDGVHLDYIRHCDVILPRGLWEKYDLVQDRELPEFDFCYCEACREAFSAQSGIDPMELEDAPSNEEWRRFRWDSVTRLVNELADTSHARGMTITAAVFPTPTIARTLVRQAWDEWSLDAVFPMLYNGFYLEDIDWIGDSVREGVAAIPATRRLYAGLYLPDFSPDDLDRAAAVAIEAGAAGFSMFELNGITDAHRTAASRHLTA